MCGIIGYIGNNPAMPILLEGLKRLEYRGYDSAGVAILRTGRSRSRRKGKIVELENLVNGRPWKATAGIAHTRWATHGEPNTENAHPHVDCTGEIAVVHNGIIENYAALKQRCSRKGHTFTSETDTEVLAHLIEKFYTAGRAWKRPCARAIEARGNVRHRRDQQARAGQDRRRAQRLAADGRRRRAASNFLASDVAAILEHTQTGHLPGRRRDGHGADPRRLHDHRRSTTSTSTRRSRRSPGTSRRSRRAASATSCSRRSTSSPRRSATRFRGRMPAGDGRRQAGRPAA